MHGSVVYLSYGAYNKYLVCEEEHNVHKVVAMLVEYKHIAVTGYHSLSHEQIQHQWISPASLVGSLGLEHRPLQVLAAVSVNFSKPRGLECCVHGAP
jgi:hypothetical protein